MEWLLPSTISMMSEKQQYALKSLPSHLCASQSTERLFQLLADLGFLEAKLNYLSVYEIERDFQLALGIFPQDNLHFKVLATLERFIREESNNINKAPQIFFNLLYDRIFTSKDTPPEIFLKEQYKHISANHKNFLKRERTLEYTQPKTTISNKHAKCHLGSVTALAITSNGQQIVSGSNDKRVKMWSVSDPNKSSILGNLDFEITSLAINNNRIVVGNENGDINIWDLENKQHIRTLSSDRHAVDTIAITKDGKKILSGHTDVVIVWDMQTGQLLEQHTLSEHLEPVDYINPEHNIFITHDIFAALRKDDRKFFIRDISIGNVLMEINAGISRVTPTSDNKKIIIAGFEDPLIVIDCNNWEIAQTINVQPQSISSIVCMPDNLRILTGSYNGCISLWNMKNGDLEASVETSSASIESLCAHPDGNRVYAGTKEGDILTWNISSNEVSRLSPDNNIYGNDGGKRSITSVMFAQGDSLIVSAVENGQISIWSCLEGRSLSILEGHVRAVKACAKTTDDTCVVTGSDDGTVRLWKVSEGQQAFIIEAPSMIKQRDKETNIFIGDAISAVAMTHDSEKLIFGTSKGLIHVFHFGKNQIIFTIGSEFTSSLPTLALMTKGKDAYLDIYSKNHVGAIQCLAINNDDKWFASAGTQDGSIKIWDTKDGKLLQSFQHSPPPALNRVFALAVNTECNSVISVADGNSDEEGVILEWNINKGKLSSSTVLTRRLSTAIVSGDKRYVLSAFVDGTLWITDLLTKNTVPLFAGTKPIQSLAISSDLRWILCGYQDGIVNLFEWNTPDTHSFQSMTKGSLYDTDLKDSTKEDREVTNTSVAARHQVENTTSHQPNITISAPGNVLSQHHETISNTPYTYPSSLPHENKKQNIALLLEILPGIIGIPGIGWIYSGRVTIGIALLVSFLVWDCIAFALAITTVGLSLFCTIPINFLTVAISTMLIYQFLKNLEKSDGFTANKRA